MHRRKLLTAAAAATTAALPLALRLPAHSTSCPTVNSTDN